MKRCIMTCCTADYYQHYIPIFVWSILNTWKDVDIKIFVRGELDSITKDAMCALGQYPERNMDSITKGALCIVGQSGENKFNIEQWYKTDYPYLPSTTNSLRFTTKELKYDEVLVTDIDFFFTKIPQDIFAWFKNNLELMPNTCYSGSHGPLKRPPRPKICKSWTGDFQRISGGFIVLYPDWWKKSNAHRISNDALLKIGYLGTYRENDEVMLYRMIRDMGLPIAPKVPFPRFLRHLHFGDFKPQMKTRYENLNKMKSILDNRCVRLFLDALNDRTFSKILSIVSKDAQIKKIIDRTINYCEKVMG